jgi:hypothetical protein
VIDQNIKFAGDYELIDVKVGSARGLIVDVYNFVLDINIYEDMFSPTISGNITLNDAQDLINLMPFIGEEKLLVTFKTPSMTDKAALVEQAFYIYKMTERKYTAERAIQYTLHFISFEGVRDLNSKLSKGYSGQISELVKRFLKNDLATEKEVTVEDTKNTISYVSNYWSPFTNINYLAKRSISKTNDAANYVFYENTRGFNYTSVDKLLEQDSSMKYIYDNNTRDPTGTGGGSKRDVTEEMGRIDSYKIDTAYDYMERIQNGMYKSRLITHEIVTKTYNVQTKEYEAEYPKHNHLNPFPLSTAGIPSKTAAFIDVKNRAFENFTNFRTDSMKSWHLKNIMQMAELHSFQMEITVPGASNVCVGDVVDVYIYRNTPYKSTDTEEDIIDKTFSGRYLVTSLCHSLNREKHNMYLTVVKESLIIDLTKEGTK